MANSGMPRAAPPWDRELRRVPPPPSLANHPGHLILNRRPGLDLRSIKPEPPDRDPMDQICVYRFDVVVLLKSPWTSFKSTRGPVHFKSNCRLAQFLAF